MFNKAAPKAIRHQWVYKKKKLSLSAIPLTIFNSAVDNTTLELLPLEVLSKDAPFATSRFLRGLGSLLSGSATWHFYFLLSFGADNDPGLKRSRNRSGALLSFKYIGGTTRLASYLTVTLRSVKRSSRKQEIKEENDFALGCPNEELGLRNLLRIKIFCIFSKPLGDGGYWNFDRQGVVQIRKPIEIKELGRCRSVDDYIIFPYISWRR